ncbi:MAG: hypothetical protein VW362_02420, partial [Candidatus Nanopelagicales bacterium]
VTDRIDGLANLAIQCRDDVRARERHSRIVADSVCWALGDDSDGEVSTFLRALRAEPIMALKKWVDEHRETDAKYRQQAQEREEMLLERWRDHRDLLEDEIERLQNRPVVVRDGHVTGVAADADDVKDPTAVPSGVKEMIPPRWRAAGDVRAIVVAVRQCESLETTIKVLKQSNVIPKGTHYKTCWFLNDVAQAIGKEFK